MSKSFGWTPNSAPPAQAVYRDQLQVLAEHYTRELSKLRNSDQPFVVDKNPFNFKWIGLILLAMPNAKIVHVKRCGCAVTWSMFRRFFNYENGFSYSLQELAEYYALYKDMMQFWHSQFPGQIFDLDYESLTEQPIEETQRLFKHIGIEWHENVLKFYQSQRPVMTASATQVKQQIYKGSSNVWKKYYRVRPNHLQPLVDAIKCKVDEDLRLI